MNLETEGGHMLVSAPRSDSGILAIAFPHWTTDRLHRAGDICEVGSRRETITTMRSMESCGHQAWQRGVLDLRPGRMYAYMTLSFEDSLKDTNLATRMARKLCGGLAPRW